jgi:hypothetical protein
VTKKSVLAIMTASLAAGTAFASTTGAKGSADRIALRESFAQYAGKVDLRDANNIVNFYYWGGDRCAAAVAPSERQIQFLMTAHMSGHEVSLDYNDVVSSYGTSRCWDGGIQVY